MIGKQRKNGMNRFKRKTMKIKTQISLITIFILLFSIIATTSVTVMAVRKKARADCEQYRSDELLKVRQKLKTLVDIAYGTIEDNHKNVHDNKFLEKYYGYRLQNIIDVVESRLVEKTRLVDEGKLGLAEAQQLVCKEIENIRYDNGTGYVWINDMTRPYPKMIMHPTDPTLNGQILDNPEYNCALGVNRNLFSAFLDVCEAHGEGFVDYVWAKPTPNGLIPDMPKLSYIRCFPDWGWIVGTGIYIDDAFLDAMEKSKADIRKMIYDDGVGYFWINDATRPFPKMVMHSLIPSLDGEILDDPQYDCALGKGENLFVAFADVCEQEGEGFVDYLWPKQTAAGLSEPVPKLSYVRLYKPLNWIVGTGVYIDGIDAAIEEKIASMNQQINHLIATIILISLLIMIGAVALSYASANTVTKPIHQVIRTMKEIEQEGISERKVDIGGMEEVQKLGDIFNRMIEAINKAVKQLTETTAAKERIESELRIARNIQMGILPRLFPAFPERSEFDIYAIIEPAKEVGGDLYDFFFIDDVHFCFLIGDVSDKGVPAAFFMAITKTLLKAVAAEGMSPGDIINKLNSDLSAENESCMFVTLFFAIMNIKTGTIDYVNAGHNPPLLLRKNQAPEFIMTSDHSDAQVMAGVIEDYDFRTDMLTLAPGDTFFLYTDGVTEAMNWQQQLYTDKRLVQEIQRIVANEPEELLNRVMASVREFTAGAPQSDDITMLALKFTGHNGS